MAHSSLLGFRYERASHYEAHSLTSATSVEQTIALLLTCTIDHLLRRCVQPHAPKERRRTCYCSCSNCESTCNLLGHVGAHIALGSFASVAASSAAIRCSTVSYLPRSRSDWRCMISCASPLTGALI